MLSPRKALVVRPQRYLNWEDIILLLAGPGYKLLCNSYKIHLHLKAYLVRIDAVPNLDLKMRLSLN